MKLILASKSEGRRRLFESLGVEFEVHVSHVDESKIKESDPYKLTQELAKLKAKTIAKQHPNAVIVGGDTVAVFEGRIIGKAKNLDEARKNLKAMSGKSHTFVSGFCVIDTATGKSKVGVGESKIKFRNLTTHEIERFVRTGLPLHRAGNYQTTNASSELFIAEISGSYTAHIGLPMEQVIPCLRMFGINI